MKGRTKRRRIVDVNELDQNGQRMFKSICSDLADWRWRHGLAPTHLFSSKERYAAGLEEICRQERWALEYDPDRGIRLILSAMSNPMGHA